MGYASPEPIKISEINAYVSLMRITDQETREELVLYLQAMDECWMKIWHKNHKSSGSAKGSK